MVNRVMKTAKPPRETHAVLGVEAPPPRLTKDVVWFFTLRIGLPIIVALFTLDFLLWWL
jgi:hypothetical protein